MDKGCGTDGTWAWDVNLHDEENDMTTQLIDMPAGRDFAKALLRTYYENLLKGVGTLLLIAVVMTALLQTLEFGIVLATGDVGPFHLDATEILSPMNVGFATGISLLAFVTIPIIIFVAALFVDGKTVFTTAENS
jgi:hypothetical protein